MKMKLFENCDYQTDLSRVARMLPAEPFSILITGATGLIGSFMVDTLFYANKAFGRAYKIYVMGRSKERMLARFPYAVDETCIHLVEQDVCEPFSEEIEADYVVNAASNADPRSYALYPAETILTNILGMKNALEYAKKYCCKQVLLTSTMEVYGSDIEADSYVETDFGKIDFNHVRSGYPESKRTAELLCRSYVDEYQISAVIARLGYIYGPTMTQTDNKVVAQFVRNILNKENIILKSRGEQMRSYLYVSDAVSGILQILFHGKPGEAFNVSSSSSVISIRALAEIAAETGKCQVIYNVMDTNRQENFIKVQNNGPCNEKVQNNVLCDEKLRRLGWCPQYDIRSGLQQTVKILGFR